MPSVQVRDLAKQFRMLASEAAARPPRAASSPRQSRQALCESSRTSPKISSPSRSCSFSSAVVACERGSISTLQRLRERAAIDGQLHLIRRRARRADHAAHRAHRLFLESRVRSGAAPAQVPHETMRAGRALQHDWLRQPALGDGQRRMWRLPSSAAREAAHQLAAAVEDFQLHASSPRRAGSSRRSRRRAGSSPSALPAAAACRGKHRCRCELPSPA